VLFARVAYPLFITPKQQNIKAHKIKKQSNTNQNIQESRAVAGNPRDAAVIFDP